jgi:hypothetical protein
MALHVDVVENRWSAGHQKRVARAWLADAGEIKVEADDGHWQRLVEGVLADAEAERPELALEALAKHFKSDYAHATEPHDDDRCEFAAGDELPFEGKAVPTQAPQPAAR